MNDSRGTSRFRSALLVTAFIVNTHVLSGCNSSNDSTSQSDNKLPTLASSGAGSSGAQTQQADDTAKRYKNTDGGLFSPSFTAFDCLEMTSPEAIADILQIDPSITCGRVSVPANWQTPDGNMIELAVYRVAPTTDLPERDPLVVLAGGPGQSGIAILPDFVDADASFLRERSEVIVVDQRGTGFSTPLLACPAVDAIKQTADADIASTTSTTTFMKARQGLIEKALLACKDDVTAQNVSLADYTTANNARDIEAIRQALDINQWNLFGGSYGTTLALTIMRDWPDGVRSAILDSAAPLEANVLTERTYSKGYWPLSRIVANCKADADCHEIIGDIQPLLEAGIARLSASPVGILDAQRYVLEVLAENIGDPDMATTVLIVASRSDEDIAHFFDLDTRLADPVTDPPTEPIKNKAAPIPFADPPRWLIPMLLADLMSAAVLCAEEAPNSEASASPDISSDFQQITREVVNAMIQASSYSDDFCNELGIPPASSIESQAVQSDLPVLILAGDTDNHTPLAWSQRVAETLPNSQYVEFPRAGHVLTTKGFDCTAELLLGFLDAPEKAVDRTCVNALPLVDYHIWTEPKTHSTSETADGVVSDK